MILDEHLDDTARAIQALDEAATRFGRHPLLTRTFGRLHRRLGHGTEALGYFRNAVSEISMFTSLNAVYTLREAAICAASAMNGTQRTWFLQAHAASEPQDDVALGAIDIGLQADAAVASFQAGNLRDALVLFKDALLSLAKLEPDANLQRPIATEWSATRFCGYRQRSRTRHRDSRRADRDAPWSLQQS